MQPAENVLFEVGQATPAGAMARPVYTPENFSGEGRTWADWSDQFDLASEINGWDSLRKRKLMSLAGKAREVYWGLAPEARTSYASLKAAMGTHLGPETQADWNRAQDRSRKAVETARDFGNVISLSYC